MICRHVRDCACSCHRVNLCECLITTKSHVDADGNIHNFLEFFFAARYSISKDTRRQEDRERTASDDRDQWQDSLLCIFLLPELTIWHPIVGQGRFHTYDEKGIVPDSRSESPLQNPASQSTLDMNCHMVHQNGRLPSSLQDVNVGEGNKGTIQSW